MGEEKVQGIDYAYTLQGWLKGINSNNLSSATDIGKDGLANGPNPLVAKDVASFSLHYFTGDYTAINPTSNQFIASLSAGNMLTNTTNLYNGNIGRMITTITDPNPNTSGGRDVLAMGNTYRYDQLQRLKKSESYTGLDIANNTWGTSQSGGKYVNEFTFDANGNILTQLRKDQAGGVIDDLTYRYYNDNGKVLQNRLYHLNDASTNTNPEELSDQDYTDPGNSANNRYFNNTQYVNDHGNYRYDKEGRLVFDGQEEIAQIVWRVDGKVKKIVRPLNSGRKNVSFEYDAMGNRIAKHIHSSANILEKSTYYVLDAQGNTISVYERTVDTVQQSISYAQAEKHIYGSSRLGVLNTVVPLLGSQNQSYSQATWTHTIGARTYEISNHLGNVLAVISDTSEGCSAAKPIPYSSNSTTVEYYLADILSSQDYSPFGVTLEGREFTLAGAEDYRYGYQGSEKDDEIKGSGNSYDFGARMYDSRVGRWLTLDPLASEYPHQSDYAFVSNCPILKLDPNGKWDIEVHSYNDRSKSGYAVLILKNINGDEVYRTVVKTVGTGRKRNVTYGDTPQGMYKILGWRETDNERYNRTSFGPNDLLALDYKGKEGGNRNGMHIHGGRQEGKYKGRKDLMGTHGCMRINDSDISEMKKITEELEKNNELEKGGILTLVDDLATPVPYDNNRHQAGSSQFPNNISYEDKRNEILKEIDLVQKSKAYNDQYKTDKVGALRNDLKQLDESQKESENKENGQ